MLINCLLIYIILVFTVPGIAMVEKIAIGDERSVSFEIFWNPMTDVHEGIFKRKVLIWLLRILLPLPIIAFILIGIMLVCGGIYYIVFTFVKSLMWNDNNGLPFYKAAYLKIRQDFTSEMKNHHTSKAGGLS